MGACNFLDFQEAEDVKTAFQILVDEALWECGHDPYNGTISTTRLVTKNPVKIADKWDKEAEDKAEEYADAHDFGEKWESRALNCGETESGLTMWGFYGWAAE